jgi:hypothetical protein
MTAQLFPLDPASQQVAAARRVLSLLNFDAERSNERSALVLLALLRLSPGTGWHEATNTPLRIVQIMEWVHDNYRKQYAPNTREAIRRSLFISSWMQRSSSGIPTNPTVQLTRPTPTTEFRLMR